MTGFSHGLVQPPLVTLYGYTSDSSLLQLTDRSGTETKNFYGNLGRETSVDPRLAEHCSAERRHG